MRPLRWGGLVLTLTFCSWAVWPACSLVSDASGTTTETVGSQSVEIDPSAFLDPQSLEDAGPPSKKILCADTPGAMRSYVVTFIDEGPAPDAGELAPGYPVTLPSSPATPCTQRVAFTNAVAGHRYVAEVDGYEEPASAMVPVCSEQAEYTRCFGDDVAPIGGGLCQTDSDCFQHGCYGRCWTDNKQKWGHSESLGVDACVNVLEPNAEGKPDVVKVKACVYQAVPGDRHMVEPGTDKPITPRWTSSKDKKLQCGHGKPGVAASPDEYERVEIDACAPMTDHGTPGATAVQVFPTDPKTLGIYACGTLAGSITKIDVALDGSTLAPKTVPCAAGESALYTDFAGAQEVRFTLSAYQTGEANATLTARCSAVTIAGATVAAKCDPLVPVAH